MAERVSAAGYIAIGKQTAPLTVVVPTIFTPYYKQSMKTFWNVTEDNPVYGNKFKSFQTLPGQRSHKGTLTVMAEPNTAAYWFDMLLTRTSSTGSAPTTHVFGVSGTQDPNPYTLDVSLVSGLVRYFGVQANKISPAWSGDEMQFNISLSALGSFAGREVASIAAQVITLTTTYDPNPTLGLVVGDLVSVKSPDGTTRNLPLVVSAIGTTTVTVTGTVTGIAAGDMLVLRPVTSPTLNVLQPFIWPLTQFGFGANAAAALAATQTRIEAGVSIDIMHDFENDDGAGRSGGFDPAALVRNRADYNLKYKEYFDTYSQQKDWLALNKKSVVMRAFSTPIGGVQTEFRFVMNNVKMKDIATPTGSDDVIYVEQEYATQYDQTDGQGMSVTIVDGITTV